MIKIVREPSDTPNIQNTDDFVGLRYSYGDYNGYVNNKGQMLAYQINGSTFKVLSGRAVVNGVEVDIDANGASITIDNISQTQAHSLYIRVNLATMKADLFDVIGNDLPTSDDLTANTAGMAYLFLYTFNSTAGVISDVVKKVEKITSLKDVISGVVLVEKAKHAEKSVNAEQTDFTNGEWQTGDLYLTDKDLAEDSVNEYEIRVRIPIPRIDSTLGLEIPADANYRYYAVISNIICFRRPSGQYSSHTNHFAVGSYWRFVDINEEIMLYVGLQVMPKENETYPVKLNYTALRLDLDNSTNNKFELFGSSPYIEMIWRRIK